MTNFIKREHDLIAQFQKEMDDYGLEVNSSTGGRYSGDMKTFHMVINTKPVPAKGQKKLMNELKELGYTVIYHSTPGASYMSFTVEKCVAMECHPDDGDEYVEPQQEPEAINEIFRKDEFAVQVVARGAFLDNDPGYGGKVYQVETATIRLNHIALGEWQDSRINREPDDFDTDEEWGKYLDGQLKIIRDMDRKIAVAAGFPPIPDNADPIVKQVLGEVFAVAYIHRKEV